MKKKQVIYKSSIFDPIISGMACVHSTVVNYSLTMGSSNICPSQHVVIIERHIWKGISPSRLNKLTASNKSHSTNSTPALDIPIRKGAVAITLPPAAPVQHMLSATTEFHRFP